MEAEHFNFPYSTGNEGLTKTRRSKKNNSRSRSHSPNLFVHFLTRLHKPQELSSIWESLSNRRKKEILDHCLESIEGAGGTQINAIDNAFSASKFLAVVLKIGKVNEASSIHRYSAEILTKMRDASELLAIRSIIIDILWKTRLINLEESATSVVRKAKREEAFLRGRTNRSKSENYNLDKQNLGGAEGEEGKQCQEEMNHHLPLSWSYPQFHPSLYNGNGNSKECSYY